MIWALTGLAAALVAAVLWGAGERRGRRGVELLAEQLRTERDALRIAADQLRVAHDHSERVRAKLAEHKEQIDRADLAGLAAMVNDS